MLETVGRYMLKTARQFIIGHKDIFRTAIWNYAKILPDPIDDNGVGLRDVTPMNPKVVTWENSYIILKIFRKFLQYCAFREGMMFAGCKIFLDEVEHDPAYRDAFQFLLEEFVEAVMSGEWQPRPQNYPPMSIWKEPRPYGNLIGRGYKQLIKGR